MKLLCGAFGVATCAFWATKTKFRYQKTPAPTRLNGQSRSRCVLRRHSLSTPVLIRDRSNHANLRAPIKDRRFPLSSALHTPDGCFNQHRVNVT